MNSRELIMSEEVEDEDEVKVNIIDIENQDNEVDLEVEEAVVDILEVVVDHHQEMRDNSIEVVIIINQEIVDQVVNHREDTVAIEVDLHHLVDIKADQTVVTNEQTQDTDLLARKEAHIIGNFERLYIEKNHTNNSCGFLCVQLDLKDTIHTIKQNKDLFSDYPKFKGESIVRKFSSYLIDRSFFSLLVMRFFIKFVGIQASYLHCKRTE